MHTNMEFIDASTVKSKVSHVDKLIEKLNEKVKADRTTADGSYSVNNTLDMFPLLTDDEFQEARKKAIQAGWELRRFTDNHDSITYKITKLT